MSGSHEGPVCTMASEDVCPVEKAAVAQLQPTITMAERKLVVRPSHF